MSTPDASSILNFAQVSPHPIYRGGQPSRDGWLYLKSLGVKTVVKLNCPDEGIDDHPDFNIIDCHMPPKDFWQAFGKPDPADVARAVAALRDSPKGPFYVHCLHGQDRTGLVVGEFRVLNDGWTTDQAYAEMMQHGFHPELIDLLRTWEEFVASRQP
jgi:tyrosine-protein phosphatase SIW14